jgi:hypothetical protein
MYGVDKNNPLLTSQIVKAEDRLPKAQGEIPEDSAARYRNTGLPRVLAIAGVAVGFVLLLLPGVVALRSYLRWRTGASSSPRAAWSVLALGSGFGVGASLWQRSPLLAVVAGLVVAVVGLSLSSP